MDRFKQRSRALRAAQTDAEARLWYRLRAARFDGWKFRRQHPIDEYIADFVCMSARLIIEIDGATHSTADELQHDEKRTAALRGLGFQLIRFTNRDIYDDLEGVLLAIRAELSRTPSPPPEGEVDGEAGGRGFTPAPDSP